MRIEVLTSDWTEYELLDSGNRRKLERFGNRIIVRDEPKAWWRPAFPESEWKKAAAMETGKGKWEFKNGGMLREWLLDFNELILQARLTDMSKHVGIFPEQMPHWNWILEKTRGVHKREKPRLLNLFGYTGIASLVAASCGFSVTHLDASKPSLSWAKKNQELSGMLNAPIRWILDDAVKFAKREIRRNSRYDALIMDPPSFGRGPDGEIWKAEDSLPEFFDLCGCLLTDNPLFIILTMYNLEASPIMLGNLMEDMMNKRGGEVKVGELGLKHKSSPKILPMSIFARWEGR